MDDRARSEADPATLLAGEGRALRALARSLLGRSDVDDVVQDAQAAAIAAPAAARRLGPWLTGAVRHLAKMLRRSEARRRKREQLAAREDVDSRGDPAVIAAQAEVVHDVAAAVRALEEPFRTVVVLRFWRGLLPRAIARELGVPLNTVRSRLQRAIERLRVLLDRRHGGRERWSAPLLVIAGVEQSTTVSGVMSGGGLLLGLVLLMKTKLFVGVAAVLVAALGVPLVWNTNDAGTAVVAAAQPQPPEVLASSDTPPAEAVREVVPAAAPSVPAEEAPFDDSPVRVPAWLARFRVVDDDEQPVADATVAIWAPKRVKPDPELLLRIGGQAKENIYDARLGASAPRGGHDPDTLLELRTDPEGRASATLELECLSASASKEGMSTGDASLWHTRSNTVETRFVLETPVLLKGAVVRPDGSPAAGAKVTARVNDLNPLLRSKPSTPAPVLADAEGRFTIPVIRHAGYHLHAEFDGERSFPEHCRIRPNVEPEVLLVLQGGITLSGVVVDPDGKPVAGAEIRIWREFQFRPYAKDYERAYAKSGLDGRFSVAVRKHARYQLIASADGHANNEVVWVEPTAVRPHVEARLQLLRAAKIGGIVQHGDGSAFAGATVFARHDDAPGGGAVPSARDLFKDMDFSTTGEDGRFELKVHPATSWTLDVWPLAGNGAFSIVMRDVKPGTEDLRIVVRDEDLAGCVVSGDVVTAVDGKPLTTFDVELRMLTADGKWTGRQTNVDAKDNHFELPLVPVHGTFTIDVIPFGDGENPNVRPRGSKSPFGPVRVGPFTTSREGVHLQVRVEAWGELPVRVLAADGTPARRTTVSSGHEFGLGLNYLPRPIDGEGRVTLKHRTPGRHRVRVGDGLFEQWMTVTPGLNPELVVRLPADTAGKGR